MPPVQSYGCCQPKARGDADAEVAGVSTRPKRATLELVANQNFRRSFISAPLFFGVPIWRQIPWRNKAFVTSDSGAVKGLEITRRLVPRSESREKRVCKRVIVVRNKCRFPNWRLSGIVPGGAEKRVAASGPQGETDVQNQDCLGPWGPGISSTSRAAEKRCSCLVERRRPPAGPSTHRGSYLSVQLNRAKAPMLNTWLLRFGSWIWLRHEVDWRQHCR